MSLSLRSRRSDRPRTGRRADAPANPPAANTTDEFWSPYLTAAEAELRIPGLKVASPAPPMPEPDTAEPESTATTDCDLPLDGAGGALVEAGAGPDGQMDADWAALLAIATAPIEDTAAPPATVVSPQAEPAGLTDLPEPPPDAAWPTLGDDPPASPVSMSALEALPVELRPPPPPESSPGPAADDDPFFTTPEAEPIPRATPAGSAPPPPDTDHPFFVTPQTDPIAPATTLASAPPPPPPDTDHPFFVTPQTDPIAPATTLASAPPPPPPDTDHPFFVTPQTDPIAPATSPAPPPPPVSGLPAPPDLHRGDRMDWSLRGTTAPEHATAALPAPPRADDQPAPPMPVSSELVAPTTPDDDERMNWHLQHADAPVGDVPPGLSSDQSLFAGAPASSTDTMAVPVETGGQCPSCGSGAKIDLVDRRRGIQHLSCTRCFRVWQEWLTD